jgi:glycine/D-amino acid oxidase-like deaminating enzyme
MVQVTTARAEAPWSTALAPAARRELELPGLEALPDGAVDVVVVGAGVTGLSAALAARAAGAQVVMLEAEPAIGRGATGRNAGILSAGINMGLTDLPAASPHLAMWPATTSVLLALVERARQPGALLVASLTGALSLAEHASAARHLAREARARQALGLRAEVWTAEQVAAHTVGRLNTHAVQAALWLPDEGRIDPQTLLAQLARDARAAGVVLVGGAQVVNCDEARLSGGRPGWQVLLAGARTLAARGIVQADGPTQRANARIYALAFVAQLPDDFPLFWDSAPYTYCDFRPGNGRLGVSGGRYGRAGAARRDAHYHAQLAAAARHWLPELAGESPSHAWAVDLAVAHDLIPQARTLGQTAPGMAIEGLGALGVLPGIVLGRRAGEAVARAVG